MHEAIGSEGARISMSFVQEELKPLFAAGGVVVVGVVATRVVKVGTTIQIDPSNILSRATLIDQNKRGATLDVSLHGPCMRDEQCLRDQVVEGPLIPDVRRLGPTVIDD
ncbi:hypothetical protein ACH5RR_029606 [Cinchona calisaya]|uniref:Uncharacterized protein n=1 Tax=Cinchona calisaya TaxID=153742 RepID=A0ABD2YVZ6_9GENT